MSDADISADAPTELDPKQPTEGGKSGWTPPASQDEFNRIITERVARERAKFAGFDDLKTKASEYDKLQEANKTELEKLTEQLATAQREATAAKREAFAATKGVPASLVTGKTPEEWAASAAEALAWKGAPTKPPAAPPAEGVQGNVGKPVGATDLAQQIEAAQKAGNVALSIYLKNQAQAAAAAH